MKQIWTNHKTSLIVFLFLLIIAASSGYIGYAYDPVYTTQEGQSVANTDEINLETNEPDSKNIKKVYTSVDFFDENEPGPNSPSSSGQVDYSLKKEPKIGQNVVEKQVNLKEEQETASIKVYNSVYKIETEDSFTAYDLMEKARQETNFDFSGQDYGGGLGYFVDSINGKKQNPRKNLYWIFYINGQGSKVGISSYIIQPNDIIEWRYENSTS